LAEVLISEVAQATILTAAQGAHPNEAGGILVGVRAANRPWITHAIEIGSGSVGTTHYVLPAGVTRPLVRCIRRVDKRLGYLGEWHIHPADVGPSETDKQTMRVVAEKWPDPILLIARHTSVGHLLEARIFKRSRLAAMEIIRTGALGSTGCSKSDSPLRVPSGFNSTVGK
jgi:integrative and conjugative element protein (TIGR02256 family)